MSIRIHKKEPQNPGFFLLSPADGSERGPLSIENLRDLAEFQHLQPDSLIRAEADANARPLSDFPDIFEIVFPKQKQFSLKPREKTDPDADLPPIDVRSLYQCLPDETPAPTAEDSAPATADPPLIHSPAEPTDVHALLKMSIKVEEEKIGPAPILKPPRFQTARVSLLVRWGVAAVLFYMLVQTWVTLADQPYWAMFISIPLLGFLMILIVSDLLDWIFEGFTNRFTRVAPPQISYNEAAGQVQAENWKGATKAYAKILKLDRRQLRAYREGITAAVAGNDLKTAAAFLADANRYLGAHDLELLRGALRRHDLLAQIETDFPKEE